MPSVLRRILGFILLLATVGLATCQSMVKAEPFAMVVMAGQTNRNLVEAQ